MSHQHVKTSIVFGVLKKVNQKRLVEEKTWEVWIKFIRNNSNISENNIWSLHSTFSVYHTIHSSWLTFCFFFVWKKYRIKYSHRNWKLRYLLPRIYYWKCLRVFSRELKWETKKFGKRKMKKRKKDWQWKTNLLFLNIANGQPTKPFLSMCANFVVCETKRCAVCFE